MSFLRTALLVLVPGAIASVAGLVAACNSSGTSGVIPDASADVAEEIVYFDGPTLFDSAAPDTGDTGAEAAPAPDGGVSGFIQFAEVPDGGGQFTAAFYGAPVPPLPGCTSVVADGGPCIVTTCTGHTSSDGGGVSLVSAGDLTVTGGAFGDAGTQIGPDNLGSYFYDTTGPMFSPGDTLSVTGAGATVPAFPEQSIVAPGGITLTSPAPTDSGALVIPTSTDLALTWTGGVAGARVIVDLTAFFAGGGSASTVCSWDASAGQGTIPAAALEPLAAGDAGTSTAVWSQQAESAFDVGSWSVGIRALVNGGALVSFE